MFLMRIVILIRTLIMMKMIRMSIVLRMRRRRIRMLQKPRSSGNLGAEMLSVPTGLWSLESTPLVSPLVHGRPRLTTATR
jgi:hypothetical protein